MKKLLPLAIAALASAPAWSQCVAPANPTAASANPASFCSNTGGTSSLSANAAASYIFWYTSSSGGSPFAVSPSSGSVNVNVSSTTVYYAEAVNLASTASTTFSYTGGSQYFVVPFGVDTVTIQSWGAQGNSNALGIAGGLGGYATGKLLVTPGDTLWIFVGGGGTVSTAGGYNGGGNAGAVGCTSAFGGGGGGASDVRYGGTALINRVIVAGGGGGAAGDRVSSCGRGTGGGGGGGYFGGGGGAGWPYTSSTLPTGGTQSAGGIGGTSTWTSVANNNGQAGSLGLGGNGGDETTSNQAGSQTATSGGDGGGLIGGNGTYAGNYTGQSGAGGSGYVGTLLNPGMANNMRSGNGQVVLTYLSACPSPGRIPVTVTINPLPVVTASVSPAASVCEGTSVTLSGNGANTYSWSGPAAVTDSNPFVITSSDAGNYIVTGTDVMGCQNSDTIAISVNPAPPLAVTSNVPAICAGDSAILAASGADNYLWIPTGGTNPTEIVAPAATATYSVTGTNSSTGCTAIATVTLTVNQLPVLAINASSAAVCTGATDTLTASGADNYSWSSGGSAASELVSPSTTTTYSVTGTNASTGCSSTDSITVTVNANPVVSISASATVVCEGSPVTMTASGANSYSWSSGGTASTETVTPSASGSYSVTGTDGNGCTGSDMVNITVNQLPAVSLTLGTSSLCVSDAPLNLTGGSPAGGTWSGTAVTGSVFNPTTAGAGTFPITYTYTDSNSCVNMATQNILVDLCSGISDIAAAGISVYPNPVLDQVSVQWNASQPVSRIEISDLTGRVVMSQQVSGSSASLEVLSLPAGVYNMILFTENGPVVTRIIRN